MQLIETYITLPKTDRQAHLDLTDPCIERGGPEKGGLSSYCKGLMAHLLDTSIPSGHKIHICHACNNGKCSNPNHLYWGTAQENRHDRIDSGDDLSVWDRMVAKYGIDGAKALNAKGKAGNTNASGNKGRILSEEHKARIAANHKGGRKKNIAPVA
jgi:hypothetical protein